MSSAEFYSAIDYVYWAVNLKNDGYDTKAWYDEIGADRYAKLYEFTPTSVDGDLYISVHTYPELATPLKCFKSDTLPVFNIIVKKGSTTYAAASPINSGTGDT